MLPESITQTIINNDYPIQSMALTDKDYLHVNGFVDMAVQFYSQKNRKDHLLMLFLCSVFWPSSKTQ